MTLFFLLSFKKRDIQGLLESSSLYFIHLHFYFIQLGNQWDDTDIAFWEDTCVYQSVQFSHSVVSNYLWPHGLQHARPPLSITNSWSLLKLMSIESVMPSNHFILCCPLLLPIFASIRVFSSESVLHIRRPKYWSLSFSICPSNEYSELISFMMDWLYFLAVQGTLKSLLQTTVQKHQFFGNQLSL